MLILEGMDVESIFRSQQLQLGGHIRCRLLLQLHCSRNTRDLFLRRTVQVTEHLILQLYHSTVLQVIANLHSKVEHFTIGTDKSRRLLVIGNKQTGVGLVPQKGMAINPRTIQFKRNPLGYILIKIFVIH